jgi:glycosyltransferase involved in cell wall biosynthesis
LNKNVNNPKFSIITVSYNSAKTISKTIESVIAQNYENIEYIIVDGNSTDETTQIIEKYADDIDEMVSEDDSGIYEAMNKGVSKASGEFILLLNADDRLLTEQTVSQIVRAIRKDDSADVYLGNVLLYDDASGKASIWNSKKIKPSSIFRGSVPHPATIYTKYTFEKNGLFNETYQIAGDYEWLLRGVMKNALRFSNIGVTTAIFYKGGVSTKNSLNQKQNEEKELAKRMYFSNFEYIKFGIRTRIKKTFGV